MRKKEDTYTKRYANTILKPTLSNQHLASKNLLFMSPVNLLEKSKKTNMMYQAPEYMILGKKPY